MHCSAFGAKHSCTQPGHAQRIANMGSVAQHGKMAFSTNPPGDAGGTDWWGEHLLADTAANRTEAGHDLPPRREHQRVSPPTRGESSGSGAAATFGIAEWTPYRRPWYGTPSAIAVIGAVIAIAVTAVVLVVGRGSNGAGDETPVAPAATTGSPSAAPPRSAGTPQTALLPPAPPPPPAEQMTPPPVVTHQWPRYEAPTQATPSAPKVSAPPSMSFAPKPVTPPQTAVPGTNKGGHHGFF